MPVGYTTRVATPGIRLTRSGERANVSREALSVGSLASHRTPLRPYQRAAPILPALSIDKEIGGTLSSCLHSHPAPPADAIHLNDRQLMASCRHAGDLSAVVAGGDEPRKPCDSAEPPQQRGVVAVLVPVKVQLLRRRSRATESRDGSRSARTTF